MWYKLAYGHMTMIVCLCHLFQEPHLKVLIADFSNAKVVGSNNNSNKDFDADFQEWKKLKGVIERKSSNFSLPINIVLRKF